MHDNEKGKKDKTSYGVKFPINCMRSTFFICGNFMYGRLYGTEKSRDAFNGSRFRRRS